MKKYLLFFMLLCILSMLMVACAKKEQLVEPESIVISGSEHNSQTEASIKQSPSPIPTCTTVPINTQEQIKAPTKAANQEIKKSSELQTVSPEKAKEAEALYDKGYEVYNEFKYDESIKYYNKALEIDPKSYKAYSAKGVALGFKGKYNEGMNNINIALEINPSYGYGYYCMAMVYKLQKDLNSSLEWFNKALVYDPNDAWTYFGISTIYGDWNNTEKAVEYLKKAIELDPAAKDVAKTQAHFNGIRNNPEFAKLMN